MSAQGVHKITEQFEQELCRYTGAPYAVAIDNCSNALFLALYYELQVRPDTPNVPIDINDKFKPIISIPRHTYPSVACEIIHAGGKCEFRDNKEFTLNPFEKNTITGMYRLSPTNVIDSSLRFTEGMYFRKSHMCLSFTGPYKHLKLGKGGAILTDDYNAMRWFKRARFSGRQECIYFDDNFDSHMQEYKIFESKDVLSVEPIAGWNFYMMPEIAARGLLLMQQFYDRDGKPKSNEDLCLAYPDLSKFKIFQQ